jgi:D-alanyl-lipoteichoic acid acyltransferase DltB (MBOAT superfamily)
VLFNSYPFLFVFLPAVLVGFYWLTGAGLRTAAKAFVIAASIVFYGWSKPWFLAVIAADIAVVWICGFAMARWATRPRLRRAAFLTAVLFLLGNLVFWKYAGVLVNSISGSGLSLLSLALPLGISFYTFQLAIYIHDVYVSDRNRARTVDYLFFTIFFPHLLAGPIVHQRELIPQLESEKFGRFRGIDIAVGLTLLTIGLAKKVLLADSLNVIVNPTYEALARGESVGALLAWRAAIAYAAQLYFDFSGYSDMAVGLARMFGFQWPINFYSPMKATSILDFWRRWHITLTRAATSYVFNPIALHMTRAARAWRLSPAFATLLTTLPASLCTFVLIGLWHGPKLTFLLFGVIHTIFVVGEYLWPLGGGKRLFASVDPRMRTRLARAYALIVIVVTLALFRAPSISVFGGLFAGMVGLHGWATPTAVNYSLYNEASVVLAFLLMVLAPNAQQILGRYRPGIFTFDAQKAESRRYRLWRPSRSYGLAFGAVFFWCLVFMTASEVVFLYFDF